MRYQITKLEGGAHAVLDTVTMQVAHVGTLDSARQAQAKLRLDEDKPVPAPVKTRAAVAPVDIPTPLEASKTTIMRTVKPEMFRDAPVQFVALVAVMLIGFSIAPLAMQKGSAVFNGMILALIAGGGFTLALIAAGNLFVWWLQTRTTKLVLDQNEILYSIGILSKTRVKLDRTRIKSVRVQQSLMHRLTNVGDVAVYTAGDVPEIVMHGMPQPNTLRDLIA